MEPFRKILYPYDFSEAATAVAPAVRAMALKFDAKVAVLYAFNRMHAYNVSPYFDGSQWREPNAIPYMPRMQELREKDEKRVEEFACETMQGVQWKTIVEDGDPVSVIDWAAKREACDLIMMATRGEGKFRRMLPGGVTAKVLHDVECMVYTSAHAPEAGTGTGEGFAHILCALRMDEESEGTLRMAAFVARAYGAHLCVLHTTLPGEAEEPAKAEALLRAFYERTLGQENAAEIDVRFRSLNSTVSDGIRNTALQESAGLVVVGRGHARAGLSRAWTHLYTVIRESPCAVLTV
jgi:nucleotide-binding universal stress UspA family protein